MTDQNKKEVTKEPKPNPAPKPHSQVVAEVCARWRSTSVAHVRKTYMHDAPPIFIDKG